MVRVAPIKLQYSPKTLWFDPGELTIHKGDAVVVSTVRGLEFGHASEDIIEVEKSRIKDLKSELKPVKRLATKEDEVTADEMNQKSAEALPIFKEMAAEASEDMHPVSVEFLFDGDKAVFYFEAEERVDFRELVRKLAARFHVRIDMRQIGVRDEARLIGGIGHCGQELCCKRLGGEFCPVSIRMAKEQDLSLNPQKISGVCGRLMCCLRYEFDAYKDFKDRAPKQGATITTPEGSAKVIDLNVPREIVTIKLEDEKPVKIPLSEMESDGKGSRPSKVSAEVLSRYSEQNAFGASDVLSSSPYFSDDSKKDDVIFAKDESSGKGKGGRKGREQSSDNRKPRRRTRVNGQENASESSTDEKKKGSSQGKKRSSGKKKQQGQPKAAQGEKQGSSKKQGSKQGQSGQKTGQRPGQKSSGLRGGEGSGSQKPPNAGSQGGTGDPQRRTRRRSHKAGGTGDKASE